MKKEEILHHYWKSEEETDEAANRMDLVEDRMKNVDEAEFSKRANKIKRDILELHRDIDQEMEEKQKELGLTQ